MINTVFLDVDNTLMDFNECARAAMELAFAEASLAYQPEMLAVFLKTNDELWLEIEQRRLTRERLHQIRWNKVFDRLGICYDGQRFEKLFLKHLETTPRLMPGALELLCYLSPKYTLCLASNAPYVQQTRRLSGSGILPYVHKVFISERLGCAKPGCGFFDACFRELPDAAPETSIIIGDSLSADITGGILYGMKTCWYNHARQPVPADMKIDYVIYALAEIQAFL